MSGHALFDLISQWIDPDGRFGWRASLVEQAEPLFVALNFLRFMLLRQSALVAAGGEPRERRCRSGPLCDLSCI